MNIGLLIVPSQITRHFNNVPKPDMSLEKLQKIATALVDAPFKHR